MKQALLVIDVQEGIFADSEPPKDWDLRFANMQGLIQNARSTSVPIIYIQHHGGVGDRLHPSQPGFALDHRFNRHANDKVIGKTACDSFYNTDLQAYLQRQDITSLVVCGCWTNYCVDTTCRRAVSLGYQVQLAADAHACGPSKALTAAQIIAHHNDTLQGFDAGNAHIKVHKSAAIQFLTS
jgi:nicotinamidase-related amidase